MNKFSYLIFLILSPLINAGEGKFMNPFTDICWECAFPMTVSGVNATPGYKEPVKSKDRVCVCGSPRRIGIPLTFWEPLHIVDVTRTAYQLVGLGGISIGKQSIKNKGTVSVSADGVSQTSTYHVHWYKFPVFSVLSLFANFSCIEKGDLDIPYLSELDPLWYDESLSLISNPEAALFSSHLAQVSCISDCAASSGNHPLNDLFWCAGCLGSIYPFTGSVAHHVSPLQASYLLVQRVIAKLHRAYVLKGYENGEFCEPKPMPIIRKDIYKTHLIYPVPQTSGRCHALGKSDLLWGVGKSFPIKGEDFAYLVWLKKHCCLDCMKAAASATAGGI